MQSNYIIFIVIFLAQFTLGLMKDIPGTLKYPPIYDFRGIPSGNLPIENGRFDNDNPILDTPDGKIQGTTEQSVLQTTYFAFRGIPFAKPPIGPLRFASPQKNDPWKGILNGTYERDWCPQISGGTIVGSEDCLYLTVCTPDIVTLPYCCFPHVWEIIYNPATLHKVSRGMAHQLGIPNFLSETLSLFPMPYCVTQPKYSLKGHYPVMVEIYGGGFEIGTSNINSYRPDYLVAKNVVYVAINYRIGILGFLSTGDSASPGNNGLRDQILALKWVKNNIKYFGGDPNRVTVFGQSAGGVSIAYLVQSRLAKGLFHRGILQSGSSICAAGLTLDAPKRAFEIGQLLGINTTNSSILVENYRQVNVTTILGVQSIVSTKFLLSDFLTRGLPFGPVKEYHHPEAVFSGNSYEQISKGDFQRIPLIIGFTSNEGGPLALSLPFLPNSLALFESDVTKFAPSNITQNVTKRIAVGTEVRTRFIGNSSIISQLPNFVRFLGTDAFARPIRQTVHLMSKYTDIYYYEFSYEGLLGNQNAGYEGASHGEDALYLFAFLNRSATAKDLIVSNQLVTLWTNFAKTGNPTPRLSSTCSESVLGNLVWKPNKFNTPNDSIGYLNINTTLKMQTNPFQADWLFYQNLYSRYGDPPYFTY